MESAIQPLAAGNYKKARSQVLELQCYLQANERTIPFAPELIEHAERAHQILPPNGVLDVVERMIARERMQAIQRMLDEAQEVIPAELSARCKQILDLLD